MITDAVSYNSMTGLGVAGSDRAASLKIRPPPDLHDEDRRWLYAHSLPNRLVRLFPQECTRNGWDMYLGDSVAFEQAQADLGLVEAMRQAHTWERMYGLAMIVPVTAERIRRRGAPNPLGPLAEPLRDDAPIRVEKFRVFSGPQLTPEKWQNEDMASDQFGGVELWTVTPARSSSFMIHASRCIVFGGIERPPDEDQNHDGRGISILDLYADAILGRDAFTQTRNGLGQALELLTFQLGDQPVGGAKTPGEAQRAIENRLRVIAQGRSAVGMIAHAKDEEIKRHPLSLAGVKDLDDGTLRDITMVEGAPREAIAAESPPGGLSADGESWQEQLDRETRRIQVNKYRDKLVHIGRLLARSEGQDPSQVRVEFRQLRQRTASAAATQRANHAQADVAYIQAGVFHRTEVRSSRAAGIDGEGAIGLDPQAEAEFIEQQAAQARAMEAAEAEAMDTEEIDPLGDDEDTDEQDPEADEDDE
jgi:phage-related protein (TIGR01555 family)